jgi:hypothetical protein
LKYFETMKEENALQMAEKTMQCMYRGGIYDHVGFGFAVIQPIVTGWCRILKRCFMTMLCWPWLIWNVTGLPAMILCCGRS